MCGIAGLTSFGGDLRGEVAVIEKMTDLMILRGPDEGGIWLGEHAALGHRRLSVIDPMQGQQPMSLADDEEVVITYSGEVYNFRELRTELEAFGQHFTTTSDTEVVLRAYLQWGRGFLERLNGIYAFAIWDARTEELLLVRDRMGVKPLYYQLLPDGVVFGSEPKVLLAHPDVEPIVDSDGLRELFSIVRTPGHAIFRDMRELEPGTILTASAEGVHTHRYWELASHEHTDDLATTIATVRELLSDAVSRQVLADVPVGTLLSGGLDSSAVTALAALSPDYPEGRVPAFSVDFTGHTERFRSDVQWADPDMPYAVEVAADIGAEHVAVVLDNSDILDPDVRAATLRCQDLPISTGDMEYSLYVLCRAVKERVTVALSGEAADELFGGYTWFHDDSAVNRNGFPWHDPFERAGGIGALKDVGLWDSLALGEYADARYAEAIAEVPRLAGEDGRERRMREISYLNVTRWENFLLDRKDRISMAVGLEVRVPFCDHRLVEYVFNAPWSMKSFDGREKSLLRAAMRGIVPDSVLDRKKNPYPATQDHEYELALRAAVAELCDPGSPVLSIVSAGGIRRLLDRPIGSFVMGGPWSARAVLERLLEFNTWMADYSVTLDMVPTPVVAPTG